MQIVLAAILGAAILIMMPILGKGVGVSDDSAGLARVTVIHKNLTSPTLEELGQKAGDPSNAVVPEPEPLLQAKRTEQWI
jgi:hypothetical protein